MQSLAECTLWFLEVVDFHLMFCPVKEKGIW